MAKFVMMVGIPGAGKSTYINKLVEAGFVVSCPDSFRAQFSPTHDEADQSVNKQAWAAANKLVVDCIASGKDVVLDATQVKGSGPYGRQAYISKLPECFKEAVYIKVKLETALERNASRNRVVPEEVIRSMYNKLEEPSVKEGFDKVTVIQND